MAKIPLEEFRTELEIKKSRFIGIGVPISSPEHAREVLKELNREYEDARHVCYAFVWGKNSTHMGMGDDGEPNGTAGRPMLEVVKGSGYENILVATVRYFGGTKLGTGGLVKAYTEITQMVIKDIPVQEYVEKTALKCDIGYNLYEQIKSLINKYKGSIIEENFQSSISLSLEIPKANVEELSVDISNLSKGEIKLKKV